MKAKTLIKKLQSLDNQDMDIPLAATIFGNGETNKNIEEVFKTLVVTFEILYKNADLASPNKKKTKRLKQRVERLRKGVLKAATLCDVALEGPEYRFLCDNEPWYGVEDFKILEDLC